MSPLFKYYNRNLLLLFLLLTVSLLSKAQTTFSNYQYINLPDGEEPPLIADLYPSPIQVSGMKGTVSNVVVTIHGLTHTFPDAIDILLVAPDGTNVTIL